MTAAETALRLLRPGARVWLQVARGPAQPFDPNPLARTVTNVQGRRVVFCDGTEVYLPPDQGICIGKTRDAKADTLTLTVSPNQSIALTILPVPATSARSSPVRTLRDIRERCDSGSWIEVEVDDMSPLTNGKLRWAVSIDDHDGHPVIHFGDPGAMPLPMREQDLRFKGENRVEWTIRQDHGWLSGIRFYEFRIRVRDDLPAPATAQEPPKRH